MLYGTKKHMVILFNNTSKEGLSVENVLKREFELFTRKNCESIEFLLRTQNIRAILVYIQDINSVNFKTHYKIINTLHTIPKLAIIKDVNDLELIRKLGEIGFSQITSYADLHVIPQTLQRLIRTHNNNVTLTEIGIKLNNEMPGVLKKALNYIEENYIKILCIKEVIDYLEISYKTLSIYFKQELLPTPKTLLMFLKIRHALMLLKEGVLLNKEVAYKAGFTNEKRFAECLNRMFGKSVSECKNELQYVSIKEFWQNSLKERYFSYSYKLRMQKR